MKKKSTETYLPSYQHRESMELDTISPEKSESNSPMERSVTSLRPKSHWWIVLPIILVSMTTATTDPVLMNDLLVRRYQIQYGLVDPNTPSSETACTTANMTNETVELSTQVQKSVGQLNMIIAGLTALPAALTYIILGANSDRIGRRPLLIIPCIGRIIRFIILLLLVELNLNNIWLAASSVIDGLFGSNGVLLLGALAYISDCTAPNERARAMILEEAAVSLTRIFPLLGLGFWLQYNGYTLPVAIDLGINVAALVYIFVFQPESCGEHFGRGISTFFKQMKLIRLAPIRGTYRVFLIRRPGHDQRNIILLTLIQILLFIILFGFVNIHALYLYGKPLCFNALDLAILTSAQFSLMIVIAIGLSCFERFNLLSSMMIPLIGTITYMIHLVLFGIAQTTWLLYLAVLVGCLFFVVMAVLRSHLTKLVTEHEFALVFIATGIVETLGSYIIGIVANQIYAQTIEVYSGIIFFILSAICLIPLAMIGYLIFSSYANRRKTSPKQDEERRQQQQQQQQQTRQDNDELESNIPDRMQTKL